MQSGSTDIRAESLRLVIENARLMIPTTNINWENPDEPVEYYSEATLERVITFLQRLVKYSVEKGDPIDIPEIFPCSKGDISLDWNFPQYSFLIWFPADPTKHLVYSGREKEGEYTTKGGIRVSDVEHAYTYWSITTHSGDMQPKHVLSFRAKQYTVRICSDDPFNPTDVKKFLQKANRAKAALDLTIARHLRKKESNEYNDGFTLWSLYELCVLFSWIFGLFVVGLDTSELRITGSEMPWYNHYWFQ